MLIHASTRVPSKSNNSAGIPSFSPERAGRRELSLMACVFLAGTLCPRGRASRLFRCTCPLFLTPPSCVVESVQQMNAARARGRQAHSKPPCELCIAASYECGTLFMAHLNKVHFVLPNPEGFHDSVDAIAWQAKNGIHPPIHQRFS